jgi:hypothetical protein
MTNDFQMIGNFGYYADDNSLISFQAGGARNSFNLDVDPLFNSTISAGVLSCIIEKSKSTFFSNQIVQKNMRFK